jgi:hypothetical protein
VVDRTGYCFTVVTAIEQDIKVLRITVKKVTVLTVTEKADKGWQGKRQT